MDAPSFFLLKLCVVVPNAIKSALPEIASLPAAVHKPLRPLISYVIVDGQGSLDPFRKWNTCLRSPDGSIHGSKQLRQNERVLDTGPGTGPMEGATGVSGIPSQTCGAFVISRDWVVQEVKDSPLMETIWQCGSVDGMSFVSESLLMRVSN